MELEQIKKLLIAQGANRIVVKCLANNDNTKQQVYLGGSFEVLQLLPSGEIYPGGISKKGPIFKAPLDFWWLTDEGEIYNAPGSQLILYPKYPEVRFSGFLKKCAQSPGHLMQPPTSDERAERLDKNRILFLGISGEKIIGYVTHWDDPVSVQVKELIEQRKLTPVATVFYALYKKSSDTREILIQKLREIYQQGLIPSQRIKNGKIVPYVAQNGAGFTLESLFGITPNGNSEPDFEDWELKTHSGSVVTLMTPEPNVGEYTENLEQFLRKYGWSNTPDRIDFASIHKNNLTNNRTNLCLIMQGYDPEKQEILDPEGGLHLIDPEGNIAAGWGFSKLLEHWKKKHSRTCFVHYEKHNQNGIYFRFGPKVRLAEGASIKRYLNSLYNQAIYYDPGINMKLVNDRWRRKKRNQFRIKWKSIDSLYEHITDIVLDSQSE